MLRLKVVAEFLGVTAGSLITALGLVFFLIPLKIAAGGVSGLATVVFYVFKWPVGLTMLLINIPLFLLSLRELGIRFGLKTLYGTIALSVFTDLIGPYVTPPTENVLLASVYGGAITGLGMGIVFRAGGSTGGTDLGARLINKFFRISVGQGLLIIDAFVITLAGIVFGIELALYALISLYITSHVIDLVQEGFGYAKAALIISSRHEEIGQAILYQLNRGATVLRGKGLYTNQERDVILTVITRAEVSKVKALVSQIDPRAFVIVTNVHEALGEGFKDITEEVF